MCDVYANKEIADMLCFEGHVSLYMSNTMFELFNLDTLTSVTQLGGCDHAVYCCVHLSHMCRDMTIKLARGGEVHQGKVNAYNFIGQRR
jgi:hypothetical protein